MPDIVLAAINAKWIHPSLALRLLKANLGRLKDRCAIMEFALRQPLREKINHILSARPRLLALSVSIWNHKATLELLEALEEEWGEKQPLVVLGGPEVSWLPVDAEIFRHADYVIRGEGEESFRSLCYRIFLGPEEPACGPGSPPPEFSETKAGRTVFINQGGTAVNADRIVPAYHLYTDEDLKKKLVYVEASRGCPYACEFCQGPVRQVRKFPLEPFLEDMKTLTDRGAQIFKFLDRTFNLDIDRAKRIMEFFLKRIDAPASAAAKKTFCVHFEMVPFRFPPDLRELIRQFPPGSLRLELGIQTLNPQTAALIHCSGAGQEEIETLQFLRRETSAIVHADLIAGLPGEDLASFAAGFDKLWQALSDERPAANFPGGYEPSRESQFEIQLGILKCLPGTPLARHNLTYGMCYSPEAPYEVIKTGALSTEELGRIKNFARFWETIVNRNPFPALVPLLLPAGKPVFDRFMVLSDRLLENFGRNWGIDRQELELYLEKNWQCFR